MSGLTAILRRMTSAATEDEAERIVAEAELDLPLRLDLASLVGVDHGRIIVAHVVGAVVSEAGTAPQTGGVHLKKVLQTWPGTM